MMLVSFQPSEPMISTYNTRQQLRRRKEKQNNIKTVESILKKTSFLKTARTGINSITFDTVASSSCRIHLHLTDRQNFSVAWNPNEDILANKWRITIKRLCFSRVHTVTPSTAWVTSASSLAATT